MCTNYTVKQDAVNFTDSLVILIIGLHVYIFKETFLGQSDVLEWT